MNTLFNQAVKAGATAKVPVQDMFSGGRYGKSVGPFGQEWSIGTQTKSASRRPPSRGLQPARRPTHDGFRTYSKDLGPEEKAKPAGEAMSGCC